MVAEKAVSGGEGEGKRMVRGREGDGEREGGWGGGGGERGRVAGVISGLIVYIYVSN